MASTSVGIQTGVHLTHGSVPVYRSATGGPDLLGASRVPPAEHGAPEGDRDLGTSEAIVQSRRGPLDGGTRAPFRPSATWIRRAACARRAVAAVVDGDCVWRPRAQVSGPPRSPRSALPGRAPGAERPWPTTAFGHSPCSSSLSASRRPASLAMVAPSSWAEVCGEYSVAWSPTGVL